MNAREHRHTVSIIVPVYNAETYLPEMLESVISQKYSDWEMLLIDNCSEDGSLEVCRAYERKDLRICVIEEKERGISTARNCGLQAAQGDYIMFIDADDFLPDDQVLERFVTTMQCQNADIVVGNYARLWNKRRLHAASHTVFSGEDQDSEDFRFQGFFSVGTLSYVWGKLYRRQFLVENKIAFENVSYAEDKLFNIQCYLCNPHYAFVSQIQYIY